MLVDDTIENDNSTKLTVNSTFDPEFFSWNSSSGAEYAAFAGDAIPESR